MLAGAYVGVAVVLLISVGAPLVSAASPFSKLIQGAVFGVALTLVVFAGAELFTGNTRTMRQGLVRRAVRIGDLVVVWVSSLIGNFVGSIAFAAAVYQSGALTIGATPGKASPAQTLLGSIVQAKDAASGGQLFWRAVLCNALVCLGLWMAARTRNDAAKCIVLWWALLAFVASGFEHSITNMTTFSLAALDGSGTWSMLSATSNGRCPATSSAARWSSAGAMPGSAPRPGLRSRRRRYPRPMLRRTARSWSL